MFVAMLLAGCRIFKPADAGFETQMEERRVIAVDDDYVCSRSWAQRSHLASEPESFIAEGTASIRQCSWRLT